MSEITGTVIEKRPRLKFIDMARSVAILLMLEGHFIHDSLDPVYADLNNPVYATWAFIRGFTAPVFLTVTGLIFVYLMLWDRDQPYTQNQRVRKGFSRGVELIFWGYLLQPTAFHVLQCIGYGILIILLIFGLYKWIKVIPLWVYYFVAAMGIFAFGLSLMQLPKGEPWPEGAPKFVQNMFHGETRFSLFPLAPWVGYTMIGAMIGCLLHDLSAYVKKWIFAIVFIGAGLLIFFFVNDFLVLTDDLLKSMFGKMSFRLVQANWVFERMGMVFIELGILMVIEKLLGEVKQNLFLKIGQNTLSVYIVHMVVLYGAITGFGISRLFRESLNPYEVVLGAVLFILLFLIFVKYIEPLRAIYNKILATILPWKYKKAEKSNV